MIHFLRRVIGMIILVLISTIIFVIFHTVFPFPFNQINTIAIIILFLIFFTRLSFVMWFVFISGYILELYSLYPFGVVLGSMILSTLAGFFFFQRFLNLFSLASFLVLLFVLITVTRISNLLLIFFTEHDAFSFNVTTDVVHLFWEFCMTALVFMVVYVFVRYRYRGTRPEYIRI